MIHPTRKCETVIRTRAKGEEILAKTRSANEAMTANRCGRTCGGMTRGLTAMSGGAGEKLRTFGRDRATARAEPSRPVTSVLTDITIVRVQLRQNRQAVL